MKYKCKTFKGQSRQYLNGDGRKNKPTKDLADACLGKEIKNDS